MGKTYFGFAIADGMFPANCEVSRRALSVAEAKEKIEAGVVSCCNPSHKPTIMAAEQRFGIAVDVPEKAPIVSLESGDAVIVMSVRGLPRLDDKRHEYTEKEVASATFVFGVWTVA